jgi:hypothetical protein
MSNSTDFLNEMLKAGEKHSASEFVTVAKMIVKLGYSGFLAGHRPSEFFKPYGNQDDAKRVAKEVTDRLKKAGSTREAKFAILLSVPQETNTSDKVTWDIEQIVFIDNREDSEYQIFVSALEDSHVPIDEWFWGTYKNVEAGEYEKGGETKTRYISLPVQKFADEQAARAAAGNGASKAADNSQWSDKARAKLFPNGISESEQEEIYKFYLQVLNGTPWPGRELPYEPNAPDGLKQVSTKKEIAEQYQIEVADVDQVLLSQVF